jgi:hypothetical protein
MAPQTRPLSLHWKGEVWKYEPGLGVETRMCVQPWCFIYMLDLGQVRQSKETGSCYWFYLFRQLSFLPESSLSQKTYH